MAAAPSLIVSPIGNPSSIFTRRWSITNSYRQSMVMKSMTRWDWRRMGGGGRGGGVYNAGRIMRSDASTISYSREKLVCVCKNRADSDVNWMSAEWESGRRGSIWWRDGRLTTEATVETRPILALWPATTSRQTTANLRAWCNERWRAHVRPGLASVIFKSQWAR